MIEKGNNRPLSGQDYPNSKIMLFHAYLRNAIAYVPTVVKLQTGHCGKSTPSQSYP